VILAGAEPRRIEMHGLDPRLTGSSEGSRVAPVRDDQDNPHRRMIEEGLEVRARARRQHGYATAHRAKDIDRLRRCLVWATIAG
jgi:hypothetical protein